MQENSIVEMKKDFEKVASIIAHYKKLVDPSKQVTTEEFVARQQKVITGLKNKAYLAGLVFSD
nr:hypothetical protein [Candidatus Sigynarchaeota archaeon]